MLNILRKVIIEIFITTGMFFLGAVTWLLFQKEWKLIGIALLFTFLPVIIVKLLLIFSTGLTYISFSLFKNKHKFLSIIFAILTHCWVYVLICIQGLVMFRFFINYSEQDNLILILTLSYYSAIFSWVYLYYKDEGPQPIILAITVKLSAFIFTLLIGFEVLGFTKSVYVYSLCIMVGFCISSIFAVISINQSSKVLEALEKNNNI